MGSPDPQGPAYSSALAGADAVRRGATKDHIFAEFFKTKESGSAPQPDFKTAASRTDQLIRRQLSLTSKPSPATPHRELLKYRAHAPQLDPPAIMTPTPVFTLNDGTKISSVLYGSYKSAGDLGVKAMKYALDEAHYGGIDTASFYGNHDEVKKAIEVSETPRDQIILQTKLWPTQMRDPAGHVDKFVEELGTYIDVLLIHWPWPLKEGKELDKDWDFVKTWKLMEKLPKSKVRSIGVSNFRKQDLEKLLAETDVVPVVNQCEFHPELPQPELVDFCLKHKIIPQAYRPLARGAVDVPEINQLAKKYSCDAGQIALSWNIKRGVIVLPKSTTESRIKSNNTFIDLTDEDMKVLEPLGLKKNRTCGSMGNYGFEYFD